METMDKCCVLKFVDDILHGRDKILPVQTDLVTRWKIAPSEPYAEPLPDLLDSDELEIPSQPELLDSYISFAEEKRSAREELRSLLKYLLEAGEDIPEPLSSWVQREYAGLNPPVKQGRPRLTVRDYRIILGYAFLCMLIPEYSNEDAIEFIACRLKRDPETIRPIVRPKTGIGWEGLRNLLLHEKPWESPAIFSSSQPANADVPSNQVQL